MSTTETRRVEQLREERADLITQATALTDTAESEQRDLSDDEATQFDGFVDAAERKDAEIKRLEKAAQLRPVLEQRDIQPERDPEKPHARPKDPDSEEKTYRPDNIRQSSFLRDLTQAKHGNVEARERLERNTREAVEKLGWSDQETAEYRDMSNATNAGAEFMPPLYLSDLAVEPNIASRPFADVCPSYPLPPTGTSISIPKLSSGVSVAARSDAGAVSETDGVTATISHDVNEVAGQVDIGRIAVMRSDPGLDTVIVRTLRRRYDSYLDTQLLSGSGTAPQHRGLDNVSSPNTVTFTMTTPTAAGTVPIIYDAIQKIASNRLEVFGDTIVMHPRRAAFLAANLSSTFPLFQQGQLTQATGTQNNGFLDMFAGLRVVLDPNIGTAYGNPGTNQDAIYVLAREDFLLAEGPLMVSVFDDVGSGNGLIRYQAFAFSAFLSNRYPKSLTLVNGSGLATPSFS